jgi:DnaB helicase-like protein/AAA domain-containing protein
MADDARTSTALPSDPQTERAILGCIMLNNAHLAQTGALSANDFSLDANRRIFRAMAAMREDGFPVDLVTLSDHLRCRGDFEAIGGVAYLSWLTEGLPDRPSIAHYVEIVRRLAGKRRAYYLSQAIGHAALNGEDPFELSQRFDSASAALAGFYGGGDDWRGLFHTFDEFQKAPPLQFAIQGFLQEDGVTLIGGLSGHGKTLVMLAMTRALLEQSPLFQWEPFAVPRPAKHILYLVPESSIGPFWTRMKMFRLEEHVRAGRLFVRTLSAKQDVPLTDARILKASEGADVFLDTAVRFIQGSENDAEDAKVFAGTLFRLLAVGARSVTGAHHAPKGFESQEYMTLENILRGSGDFGAMLCTGWGVRQVDAETNRIYVQNVKPRDYLPCQLFVIEGRPHLDTTGHFMMLEPPGFARPMKEYLPGKRGAPETPDKTGKLEQARAMQAKGDSIRDIASKLGVSKSCVHKWLSEDDDEVSTNSKP